MAVVYFTLITILCFINVFAIYNVTTVLDIIRQPIQFFLILSAFYQTFVNSEQINRMNKTPIVITLFFLLYLLFQILLNSNNYTNDLSNSLFGIIVFYLFYTAKYDYRSLKKINRYSFVALLLLSGLYIYRRIDPSFKSPDAWSLYVNSIYYPLCMLPYTLFNKKYALISLISVLLCSFISAKQGAFIAIVIVTFIYYYISQRLNGKRIGIKFLTLLCALGLLGLIAYSYIVDTYNIDIIEGFSTISEDGGNGRIDISLLVLTKLGVSDSLQLIFGHGGLNSVANSIGISAHNDFLEVFYDFGIIGFILYIAMISIIIKYSVIAYKNKRSIAIGLLASVSIFLVLSMISHIMFILKYGLLIFSFWGMGLNLLNQRAHGKKANCNNCTQSFAHTECKRGRY